MNTGLNRKDALAFEKLGEEKLLHTPVFDVYGQLMLSPDGVKGNYVSIDAPDWVVIVAVHEGNFVLVRQWRHGEGRVTMEFPGGVADPGEKPVETALRELEEETGYRAGRITLLGKVSSNTALFRNHFSVFLAEELVQTGLQHLDRDEVLKYTELPVGEVIRRYGDEEFTHAYMGTALAFYFRYLSEQQSEK